jgi:hypothetical protein
MTQTPERLSHLFKLPAQLKIARDFLRRKLRDSPGWVDGHPVESLEALAATDCNAHALAVWCLDRLTGEQIRLLQKVLRLAANQQRVYKRTVMLSPRAHLLVKTLAEQEGLKMSDVIELHLDGVLRQRFGLTLRTAINEHTGQVDHDIVPIIGEA